MGAKKGILSTRATNQKTGKLFGWVRRAALSWSTKAIKQQRVAQTYLARGGVKQGEPSANGGERHSFKL
ncbi:MAG: hypothetical protein BA874_07345 [Desulfuromonadales bacterium C00003068]|jgi:hypothetical protein|nr:MAG: hypothetical protein BA874_07345 [Desulfuromonadales bacterium C00003068]